ncbi:uncharacterized protein LOC113563060 [Ooceraea biroi]|uniref:uncharacterized protein LOC113563060 n=1 Tax=Ooceraea biroi TaxID=2015173 RepID=UPI000F090D29|nr:uncharacterized protein LOC113563060 [Ooceraea biroi]
MLRKCTIMEDVEYFLPDSQPSTEEEESEKPSLSTSDEEYMQPAKISTFDRVSFDTKLKIVMTAREHPKWSFKTLQQRFKQDLRHNSDVVRFRNEILSGGTFFDKIETVKKNVYDRFVEARDSKQLITRRQLQQWAMAAATQYRVDPSTSSSTDEENQCTFRFVASPRWLTDFLTNYREREIFYNVNQLCFPSNLHNIKCICQKTSSFIKCSWCATCLCFKCFYIDFHPQHCAEMSAFYNCGDYMATYVIA